MNVIRIIAAVLALAAGSAQAIGRLADVSIVDRGTGQDLGVTWHEGRAYVAGRPGAEYEVVVTNRAGEDLLAVVSVDGINAVTGETAAAQQAGYVLRPWETTTIRGWRKSLRQTASFYFTSREDSYAGRTGRPDDVGVIGVALFRRLRASLRPLGANIVPPSPQPAENNAAEVRKQAAPIAPADLAPRMAPASPLATGHGRREHSPVREVRFERASIEPAEVIAFYYDSESNLAARGITVAQALRLPSPFPRRFVPDPPR